MSDPHRARVVLETSRVVECLYTNHRRITQRRRLRLAGPVYWGATEFHPEPGWLVPAVDVDRRDGIRMFSLKELVIL